MTPGVAEPRVSAAEADWSREAFAFGDWTPGRRLLAAIRLYQRNQGSDPLAALLRRVAVARHRFWSAVAGADIPINVEIAGGLMLPHPVGIVVHPASRLGPNCLLFQCVTLGTGGRKPGAPQLGGHVDVGAGAKILGGVRIGDDVVIGANAVVLDDVPAGATAVGVPARVLLPARAQGSS